MAGLAQALALSYSPKLTRVRKVDSRGLRGWLSTGDYQPIATQNSLVLVPTNSTELYECLASDICRLVMAGHETLASISDVQKLPKSASWTLIKLYYAAFYYSQCGLKFHKNWPTYFPTTDLLKLRSICGIYGVDPPYRLTTGQFDIKLDDQAGTIELIKNSSSSSTHEVMWDRMVKFLQIIIGLISSSPFSQSERQKMSTEIGVLEAAVKAHGFQQQWLSTLRNDIQYAQKMGVWHPHKESLRAGFANRRLATIQTTELDTSNFMIAVGKDCERFFEQSLLVCYGLRTFMSLLSEREPKSFMNQAPSRLEAILNA